MSQSAVKNCLESISYRMATLEDLQAIHTIEEVCFTTPWSKASLAAYIGDEKHKVFSVALYKGQIIAYMGSSFILDEGEVTNVATLPAYRSLGIGEGLVRYVVEALRQRRVKTLFLEVRPSNAAAIHIYKKCGFKELSRRKDYYSQPKEDALIYSVQLGEKA